MADNDKMMMQGAMSDKEMNMMTPEEEIILDSLMKAGISMNTALDIMASNKVDSMNKLQQLRDVTDQPVRPQEFGGLPKMTQPTAPQGQPMPMGKGAMSQQDMMNYLASKTNTTKNAMGNMLSAMGGATPMMQPQMRPTGMGTTSDAEMRALQNATQQPMPPANPMMRR